MKDLDLVSIYTQQRANAGDFVGGPVAILLQNDKCDHFLGAYIDDKKGEKLVLDLFPKKDIGNTVWQRNVPYSERLLRHVAMLNCVGAKNCGAVVKDGEEGIPTESQQPKIRTFGSGGSRTAAEVAAVKADLASVMGKYEQIVKKE